MEETQLRQQERGGRSLAPPEQTGGRQIFNLHSWRSRNGLSLSCACVASGVMHTPITLPISTVRTPLLPIAPQACFLAWQPETNMKNKTASCWTQGVIKQRASQPDRPTDMAYTASSGHTTSAIDRQSAEQRRLQSKICKMARNTYINKVKKIIIINATLCMHTGNANGISNSGYTLTLVGYFDSGDSILYLNSKWADTAQQILISPFIPSSFSQQHTYLQLQQEQKIIDTIKRGYTCVWEAWCSRTEELEDVNQLECVFNNAYCLSHLCKRCSGGEGGHLCTHCNEEFCIILSVPWYLNFYPF